MKLIRFEDLPATPWKNGGGVTRELYSYPAAASFDTFVWRVSIADVAQSGAFSSFAGVDRVITLLSGDGMRLLSDDSAALPLLPLQPYRFRGEQQIAAQLQGGVCRDFNLMLRRGVVSGDVQVWHGDQDLPGGCDLLYCVHGGWEVLSAQGEQVTLTEQQALVCDSSAGSVSLRSLRARSTLISVNIQLQQEIRHAAQSS